MRRSASARSGNCTAPVFKVPAKGNCPGKLPRAPARVVRVTVSQPKVVALRKDQCKFAGN